MQQAHWSIQEFNERRMVIFLSSLCFSPRLLRRSLVMSWSRCRAVRPMSLRWPMREKYLPGEEEKMVQYISIYSISLLLTLSSANIHPHLTGFWASYQQATSLPLVFTAGRLGLGNQDTHNSPEQVCLPVEFEANRVVCGVDCSIIISSQYSILACGSNR